VEQQKINYEFPGPRTQDLDQRQHSSEDKKKKGRVPLIGEGKLNVQAWKCNYFHKLERGSQMFVNAGKGKQCVLRKKGAGAGMGQKNSEVHKK